MEGLRTAGLDAVTVVLSIFMIKSDRLLPV